LEENKPITAELIDQALFQACLKGGYCTKLTGQALLKKYQNNVTATFCYIRSFRRRTKYQIWRRKRMSRRNILKCSHQT